MVSKLSLPHTHQIIAFHGDADGIAAGVIAAAQRSPGKTSSIELISGSKSDMNLAQSVYDSVRTRKPYNTDIQVTILDVPFDKNHEAIAKLIAEGTFDPISPDGFGWQGADDFTYAVKSIDFIDHHSYTNPLPDDKCFRAAIDTSSGVSTAAIMNTRSNGYYPGLAIVGLAGDNRMKSVDAVCAKYSVNDAFRSSLVEAGKALNYNAFAQISSPITLAMEALSGLYARGSIWNNDLGETVSFVSSQMVRNLRTARADGLSAMRSRVEALGPSGKVNFWALPNDPTSAELFADIAYEKQDAQPDKYHVVFAPVENGEFDVSFRGPEKTFMLAKALGGGGRETAAGAHIKMPIDDAIRTLTASEAYKTLVK